MANNGLGCKSTPEVNKLNKIYKIIVLINNTSIILTNIIYYFRNCKLEVVAEMKKGSSNKSAKL